MTLFFCVFQIKIPKGIPAGGIKISVSGKNLAYIQNPQMYVYYKDKMFGSVSKQILFSFIKEHDVDRVRFLVFMAACLKYCAVLCSLIEVDQHLKRCVLSPLSWLLDNGDSTFFLKEECIL